MKQERRLSRKWRKKKCKKQNDTNKNTKKKKNIFT